MQISPTKQTRNTFTGEIVLSLFLSAFALFVIVEALYMPRRGQGFLMSPGFVPLLAGSALLLLSLLFLFISIKKRKILMISSRLCHLKSEISSLSKSKMLTKPYINQPFSELPNVPCKFMAGIKKSKTGEIPIIIKNIPFAINKDPPIRDFSMNFSSFFDFSTVSQSVGWSV